MSVYRRDFDETKYMYFLIKNDKLSEKYNEKYNEKNYEKFGKTLKMVSKKDLTINQYTIKNI